MNTIKTAKTLCIEDLKELVESMKWNAEAFNAEHKAAAKRGATESELETNPIFKAEYGYDFDRPEYAAGCASAYDHCMGLLEQYIRACTEDISYVPDSWYMG